MASVQCGKPAEQSSCHQGHQEHSLSQKVSQMASSIFKGHGNQHGRGPTTGQGHMSHTGQNHSMSQTTGHHNGQHGSQHTAMACPGKTKKRGEHKKRGLIQKLKDGFSDDSSSSDSESDDEKCGRRKN